MKYNHFVYVFLLASLAACAEKQESVHVQAQVSGVSAVVATATSMNSDVVIVIGEQTCYMDKGLKNQDY